MHDLQAEMHNKRREAYEQEDRLGTDNPPVFATVQVNTGAGTATAAATVLGSETWQHKWRCHRSVHVFTAECEEASGRGVDATDARRHTSSVT